MRGSRPGLYLALLILTFLVAAGWILHRGRERTAGDRPGGAGAAREDSSREDPAAGAAGARPAEEAGAEPGEAIEPAIDRSAIPSSIEGRVTDAAGNGVAGARVAAVQRKALTEAIARDEKLLERAPLEALRAFQRSLEEVAERLPSTLTSADGSYALCGLPDGEHRAIVTHPDFLAHRKEDWLLVEVGTRARYDVELAEGHSISGLVRDGSGAPVPGVQVRATPVETARLRGVGKVFQVFIDESEGAALVEPVPAMTDALGTFRLTSLAPGAHDLRLVKEGYAWGEVRDVASGAEEVLVTLEPATRIEGRVVSPAREPVASAAVVLREPERDIKGPAGPLALAYADLDLFGEKERAATTGEDGRFALEAFCGGTYLLAVRAQGFPERRLEVTLEGVTLDLGVVVLAEGREIAGTVLSHDGLPVEGADVWVPRPSSRMEGADSRQYLVLIEAGPSWSIASARTDRRGAFRLTGLGGEGHDVAVLAGGHPGRVLENVLAGGPGVTIALERGLTIRGRVADAESDEALPGARVAVIDGEPAREAVAGEEGFFEIRGVTLGGGQTFGGSVVVRASREGYSEARETVVFPDPAAVPVAAVDFALRRPGPAEGGISGIVRDANGAPLAGVLVRTEVAGWPAVLRGMEPPGGLPKEVRTGAGGAFTVRAPQIGGTTFEVVASRPGLAESRAGPFPQHPEDEGWPFVEIRLGEGASVEGRVTGLGGAPLAGARVRIWREAQVPKEETIFTRILPHAVGEVACSARDGTYRLKRIEPGSYRVEARARGYAAKAIGPLEIEAAGAPSRIDITLERGGSLEGRVFDSAGEPLSGIEVVAIPIAAGSGPMPDEDDELVRTGALGAAGAVTGSDGGYRLEHLPAGELRVLARARGFEPAWTPPAAPGEALPDLVLARHARIAGRVRGAESGAPIERFAVRLDRRDAEGAFREDHNKARDAVDPGGRFACEGLRAGEWRVRVEARGHAACEREVSLEPGGDVDLDVSLSAGRRIEGIVRRPDGVPIAGAMVTLRRDADGRDLESVRSGEEGEFAFGGLEEGSYRVLAVHPEHHAGAGEGAAKVAVAAGEDAAVEIELLLAGRVLGRVRGLVFEPPGTDIFVVVLSPIAGIAPGPAFQAWADEKDTVRMDSVRPGTYRIELTHRRNAPDTGGEWISVPPESRPLGEVEVRAGEMATFEVEAP